jgi:hypothetical protein
MADKRFWITLPAFACLGIYLFATAPPPLPKTLATDAVIPVEEMFAVLEAENDAVRAL